MGSTSSVVEINGNQYDAYTGQLIKAGKKTKEQVKYHTARMIDGIVKSPSNLASKKRQEPQTIVSHKVDKEVKEPVKKVVSKREPRVIKSAKSIHQRQEKSRTLMRQAVSRPVAMAKKSISGSLGSIVSKPSTKERAVRAEKIVKHAKVRRFGSTETQAQDAPSSNDVSAASVSRPPSAASISMSARGVAAASMPAASLSNQRLERMLDQALAQADNFKERASGKGRGTRFKRAPKWLSIFIGILIAALIGLFFAWQSVPQLALKVASFRSHVSASLPSYTPSGFNYAGHIKSHDGQVTIPYQSTVNTSQSYTVTEQPSSQDTTSMVANNTSSEQQVQTSQANGVPIVIVGSKDSSVSDKAMCVSNGVQTTVNNLAKLSPDELLNIAKSVCSN